MTTGLLSKARFLGWGIDICLPSLCLGALTTKRPKAASIGVMA